MPGNQQTMIYVRCSAFDPTFKTSISQGLVVSGTPNMLQVWAKNSEVQSIPGQTSFESKQCD